jgi:hypothetical protein
MLRVGKQGGVHACSAQCATLFFVGGRKCIAAGREEKELGFSSGPRSPFFIQHALESGQFFWLDDQDLSGVGAAPPYGPESRPRPRLRPRRAANAWLGRQRATTTRMGRQRRIGPQGRSGPKYFNFFPGILFSISRNWKTRNEIRKTVQKIQNYIFPVIENFRDIYGLFFIPLRTLVLLFIFYAIFPVNYETNVG